MNIEVNHKELVRQVVEYLEVANLNQALKTLTHEFDWNPFNNDGDEYDGFWPEVRHNMDLVNDVIMATVMVLEKATVGGRELKSPEKLDIAVGVLDEALRLPWYAEMFDGPLLKILVSQAVSIMNKVHWAPTGPVTATQEKVLAKTNMDGKIALETKRTNLDEDF